MKKWWIATGLVGVLVISMFTFIPTANAWTSGQGWGYKWVEDWGTMIKKLQSLSNNSIKFTGDANGKSVNAVFIKYSGSKNGYERFNFEGSYYTYGHLKGDMKVKYQNTSLSLNIDSKIKSFWVDYSGYFDLVKYQPSWGYFNSTCYGIQDIMMSYYTKKPLDLYSKGSGNFILGNTTAQMTSEYQLQGYISVTAYVTFDKPIPYLPANNSPPFINPYITANYSGVAQLNTNGYMKASGTQQSVNMGVTVSLDSNIKKNLNGMTYISPQFINNYSSVYRIGIPEDVGIYALNIIQISPTTNKVDADFDGYLYSLMDTHNQAIYDNSSKFYKTITISPSLYQSNILGSLNFNNAFVIMGSSQPATEEEVKDVENNAPSIYGSYQESFWDLLMNYLLYIIIGIVVAVAVVVPLIIIRRKRKIQRRKITQPRQQIQKTQYKPPQGEVKKSELEDKLRKLKELRDDGILTEEEYQSKKEEVLRKEGY